MRSLLAVSTFHCEAGCMGVVTMNGSLVQPLKEASGMMSVHPLASDSRALGICAHRADPNRSSIHKRRIRFPPVPGLVEYNPDHRLSVSKSCITQDEPGGRPC